MSDILERLHGYNPPDRTVDDQRQIAIDIQDAAEEIARLNGVIRTVQIIRMADEHEITRLKEENKGLKSAHDILSKVLEDYRSRYGSLRAEYVVPRPNKD